MRTVLAGTLAGTVIATLPAGAQAAVEEYPVRADGTVVLEGRGWGHGVGLSQYGAKRGAELGNSATSILSAYYPGAQLTAAPTKPLRVLLKRWDGATNCTSTPLTGVTCAAVTAEPGHSVVDVATGARTNLPGSIDGVTVTAYTVGASSTGLSVYAKTGGWRAVPGLTSLGGPVDLQAVDGVQSIRIGGVDRSYRGSLRLASAGGNLIRRINVVGLEDYLLGVVPSEMPASWSTAAVQTQAVAARSYAVAQAAAAGSRNYDLCDTTACQVYGGVGAEQQAATDKIRASLPSDVRGKVLSTSSGVVTTFFGSSNGGHSVSGSRAWLPARPDAWDPASTWTRTITGSCLAAKHPGRGAFQKLVVTGRDGQGAFGGRVTSLRLEFASGAVTVGPGADPMATDALMRGAFYGCGDTAGLRSSLWRGVAPAAPVAPVAPVAPAPTATPTAPTTPAPTPTPAPTQSPVSSPAPSTPGVLAPGQTVNSGGTVTSRTGQFTLAVDPVVGGMTRPGVILRSRTCSNATLTTAPSGNSRLVMQTDGNLVLYQGSSARWNSGTARNPGATAVLTDDGAVQVQAVGGRVLWRTPFNCSLATGYDTGVAYTAAQAPRPATLLPGDRLTSADRSTSLIMQTDGNLVLYRGTAVLFQARTQGNPGARTVVQEDGNVVVYSSTGRALHSTGTRSPTKPAGRSDVTFLRVDTGQASITRVQLDTATGNTVSSAVLWRRP